MKICPSKTEDSHVINVFIVNIHTSHLSPKNADSLHCCEYIPYRSSTVNVIDTNLSLLEGWEGRGRGATYVKTTNSIMHRHKFLGTVVSRIGRQEERSCGGVGDCLV